MCEQIDSKKRIVVKISLISFFLIVLFCVVQIIDYSIIHSIDIEDISDDENISWVIDFIKIDRNYIAISGWAFIIGEVPKDFDINVVLVNTETKQGFVLPTVLTDRKDLEDVSSDRNDYSHCGFVSKVLKCLLGVNENSYEIYINMRVQNRNYLIKTNQLLIQSGGE